MTKIKHQILRSTRRRATIHTCQATRKQGYSKREAKRAARKIAAVAVDPRPLEVYHCPHCDAHHIGHRRSES